MNVNRAIQLHSSATNSLAITLGMCLHSDQSLGTAVNRLTTTFFSICALKNNLSGQQHTLNKLGELLDDPVTALSVCSSETKAVVMRLMRKSPVRKA